jgi:tyrosinase
MRTSFASAAFLAACAPIAVSAASLPFTVAPALPLNAFPPNPFVTPLSLDQAKNTLFHDNSTDPKTGPNFEPFAAGATCSNPRVRTEWDSATDTQKQQFVDALKCLIGKKSSGNFAPSTSRYEDFVKVHQSLTPNVHGNAKFLLWHRFYLWALEDVMRSECGFQGDLLWFDETRYSGRFSQSSIFSDQWMGAVGLNGNCVTNGVSIFNACGTGLSD